MSDVLARAAEVLGAHWRIVGDPDVLALCSCGVAGMVRALSQIEPWFARHQARALADAGLLAESAPAERCPPRPTTRTTVDSLTARLVAARAATDGYRTEAERLRELLDEAHAKIERMEAL